MLKTKKNIDKHSNKKTIKNKYKKYELLSPFELKNKLIKMAKSSNNKEFLNAGRGNPNFFNSFVRKVFGILHNASLEISDQTSNNSIDTRSYIEYKKEINFKKELLNNVEKELRIN
jgi:3-deoxy-D-manno-octulosonic acid (KDO) 8-phosphate synthase